MKKYILPNDKISDKPFMVEYNLGRFRLKHCKNVYFMLFGLIPIYLFNINRHDPESVINEFNKIASNKL